MFCMTVCMIFWPIPISVAKSGEENKNTWKTYKWSILLVKISWSTVSFLCHFVDYHWKILFRSYGNIIMLIISAFFASWKTLGGQNGQQWLLLHSMYNTETASSIAAGLLATASAACWGFCMIVLHISLFIPMLLCILCVLFADCSYWILES